MGATYPTLARALPEEERRVRAAYILERKCHLMRTSGFDVARGTLVISKNWDGATDSRGVRHTSAWKTIIQQASRAHVDPVSLVKAAFMVMQNDAPPLPTQVYSNDAVKAAQCLRKQSVSLMSDELLAHQREAETMLALLRLSRPDTENSKLWREILVSPVFSAGPLFRYGLACWTAQADLARRIRYSATMEYIQAPDVYDEVMGKFLPPDFREGSRQLLEKLLSDIE